MTAETSDAQQDPRPGTDAPPARLAHPSRYLGSVALGQTDMSWALPEAERLAQPAKASS